MSEEAKRPPEPPKDYVTPRQRVDVDHHISKVTTALERPSSVLLFVVIILGIVVGGTIFDTKVRSGILGNMLTNIEDNRANEIKDCQTTLRLLINHLGDRRVYEAFEKQRQLNGKSE